MLGRGLGNGGSGNFTTEGALDTTEYRGCGLDTELLTRHNSDKSFEGRARSWQSQRRMTLNHLKEIRIVLFQMGTKLLVHSFIHGRKLDIFAS